MKYVKIYPPYISKNNSNHENQAILLMISNVEKWHYLSGKKLSALLKGFHQKVLMIFIVSIVYIPLEQKANLSHIRKYVKINILKILYILKLLMLLCPLNTLKY